MSHTKTTSQSRIAGDSNGTSVHTTEEWREKPQGHDALSIGQRSLTATCR